MISAYNLTSGFDACLLPNDVSYKTKVEYIKEDLNVRPNDTTVRQEDFYDSRVRHEYPESFQLPDLPVVNGQSYPNYNTQLYSTVTEYNFELGGFTDFRNIFLEYKLDLFRVGNKPDVGFTDQADIYPQTCYAFLNSIEYIECYIGKNKQIINTNMTDILSIKRHLQLLNKTEYERRMAAELGLDYDNNINIGLLSTQNFADHAATEEGLLWRKIMQPVLDDYKSGKLSSTTKGNYSRSISVPLYFLIPFFNQRGSYLPKDFPIKLIIKWNTCPTAAYYTNDPANNFTTYSNIYTLGGGSINIGLDYVLSNKWVPRISYTFSRMTFEENFKNTLASNPMKFNFFSYMIKRFSNHNGTDSSQTLFSDYLSIKLDLTDPFRARPLEIIIAANILARRFPYSEIHFTNAYGPWAIERVFANMCLFIKDLVLESNGRQILNISNKALNPIIGDDPDESSGNWIPTATGNSAYQIMEQISALENNSTTFREKYCKKTGTVTHLIPSIYRYCISPGSMYRKNLQANVDGVQQFTLNMNYFLNNFNCQNNNSETTVYLKYISQLVIDYDFNIILIDLPAISI